MAVQADRAEEDLEQQEEALGGQMSFLDHLEELRRRIIHMLIAVGIAFILCWSFGDHLFQFVSRPIRESGVELYMMRVTEGFSLQLKVSLLAAIFLTTPFIMAQVWLFISPGLYKHERRYALPFVLASSLLFLLGGAFGYLVAVPMALPFLIGFGTDMGLSQVINATDYFDLLIALELGLGAIFLIPAIIFVLSRIGLVSAGFLFRNTKYAILGSVVVAAIITPTPDAATMMVVAVPIIALYLFGGLVAFVFGKKREKGTKK